MIFVWKNFVSFIDITHQLERVWNKFIDDLIILDKFKFSSTINKKNNITHHMSQYTCFQLAAKGLKSHANEPIREKHESNMFDLCVEILALYKS